MRAGELLLASWVVGSGFAVRALDFDSFLVGLTPLASVRAAFSVATDRRWFRIIAPVTIFPEITCVAVGFTGIGVTTIDGVTFSPSSMTCSGFHGQSPLRRNASRITLGLWAS